MSRNNVKRSSSIRLWSYISAAHCICSSACCSFCSPLHLLLRLLQLNCPKSLFTFRLPGLSWCPLFRVISLSAQPNDISVLLCIWWKTCAHFWGVYHSQVQKFILSLLCKWKKKFKMKKKKRHLGYRIFFYQWQMQWSKLHSNTFLTPALHGWGVGVD